MLRWYLGTAVSAYLGLTIAAVYQQYKKVRTNIMTIVSKFNFWMTCRKSIGRRTRENFLLSTTRYHFLAGSIRDGSLDVRILKNPKLG
jgi:hypothetical protein